MVSNGVPIGCWIENRNEFPNHGHALVTSDEGFVRHLETEILWVKVVLRRLDLGNGLPRRNDS